MKIYRVYNKTEERYEHNSSGRSTWLRKRDAVRCLFDECELKEYHCFTENELKDLLQEVLIEGYQCGGEGSVEIYQNEIFGDEND